ncbi:Zinc transporter ZIP1 [Eumeta japonica]|uniref:Zinc transporter ZIP1 n=1 Tax=Eumeta variegata TaxID=151549 RepID=A0A4C1VU62_EUMVA|nr:Zinc transporter ZIP1 [Eumeta japonica]
MQVNAAKALAMLALGLGSFITGMIPAWFSDRVRQRYPLFISALLCFGGGVLLSTSLIHMLPEAREKLPNYSELALCVGFFIVYLVDELVHAFYGTQGIDRTHSNQNYGSTERTDLLPPPESQQQIEGEEARCCGDAGNPRMCHVSHTPPCNKSAYGMIGLFCALFVHSVIEGLAIGLQQTSSRSFVPQKQKLNSYRIVCLLSVHSSGRLSVETLYFGNTWRNMSRYRERKREDRQVERKVNHKVSSAGDASTRQSVATPIASYPAALDVKHQVLLLFGAVASHKYVVGFCLGAELVASLGERKVLHLVCILVFSLASVVGIALGAGLEVIAAIQNSLAVPIMQALAAGTLLYVTVSEVLPRERASWHGRRRAAGLSQFGAVLAGFALMYVTTVCLDESNEPKLDGVASFNYGVPMATFQLHHQTLITIEYQSTRQDESNEPKLEEMQTELVATVGGGVGNEDEYWAMISEIIKINPP